MTSANTVIGAILLICNSETDVAVARALCRSLRDFPVYRVCVLGASRRGLLRMWGGGFDEIVALTEDGAGSGEAAYPTVTSLAGLRDHLKPVTTRILSLMLFDDRASANAQIIEAARKLQVPSYLVQSDPAMPERDMWLPGRKGAAPLWGHSRPSRIVVHSGGQAMRLIQGLETIQAADFALSSAEHVLLGGLPWPARAGGPASGADLPTLLVQQGCVSAGAVPALRPFLRAQSLDLAMRDFGAADFVVPGGAGSFAIAGSPTAALLLVRAGYRVILTGWPGTGLDDGTGPLILCKDEALLPEALDRLATRAADPDWRGPAALAAWQSSVSLFDTLRAEIEQRIWRQLRRDAKALAAFHGKPPNPIFNEGAAAQLSFPLFPLDEFRRALGAISVPEVRRLVTISHDWSTQTGLARPMKYYNCVAALLGVDILVLTFDASYTADKIRAMLRPGDFVIFNSFGIFERTESAFDVYDALPANMRAIYLHEMAYTFDRFREKSPERHDRLAAMMPDAQLMCVCRKQADFLQERYGATNTAVVYNTTSLPKGVTSPVHAAPRTRLVAAMIGTVQARKGAELFSGVADLARQRDLGLDLRWIGGMTEESASLYLSPNAAWLGRREGAALAEQLREVDILFLSSVDDPFPLSVIEAIKAGKRVVCYAGTGIEEILRGVPGCAVFDDYTPEAALDALLSVSHDVPQPDAYARLDAEVFGLAAFANRMTGTIEAIRLGKAEVRAA